MSSLDKDTANITMTKDTGRTIVLCWSERQYLKKKKAV